MNFRDAVHKATAGAKANLLPGLLLQALMLVFFCLYISHEGTRHFLANIADIKREAGYRFAFVSYVIAAAFLPELLRVAFFQDGRATRANLWSFLTAAPFWGCIGMLVDYFYRLQMTWFGPGDSLGIVLTKMVVDQFIFSPFLCLPLTLSYFIWRDAGFRLAPAAREIFSLSFIIDRAIPSQVAGWMIWIPGVSLVYFVHSELQIPVAALIQTFWVLVLTFTSRRTQSRSTSTRSPLRS